MLAKVHGPGVCRGHERPSIESPAAIARVTAGDAGGGIAPAAPPGCLGEFTADLAATAELARRREGAAIGPTVPFIRTTDIAIQSIDIDRIGLGLILTVHVAGDDVTQNATADHAAHGGKTIAVAGGGADQATRGAPPGRG